MTDADGVYAELSAFGILSQDIRHEEYDINVGCFFFFAPSSSLGSFLHPLFYFLMFSHRLLHFDFNPVVCNSILIPSFAR